MIPERQHRRLGGRHSHFGYFDDGEKIHCLYARIPIVQFKDGLFADWSFAVYNFDLNISLLET
jgi:hypothetical protein